MKNLIITIILFIFPQNVFCGGISSKFEDPQEEENKIEQVIKHDFSQRTSYSSIKDSPFSAMPVEIILKIMDDEEVYCILIQTSYTFFCLACHPEIARIMQIDSEAKWKMYLQSSLLKKFSKVKIGSSKGDSKEEMSLSMPIISFKLHVNPFQHLNYLDISNMNLENRSDILTILSTLSQLNFLNINTNYLKNLISCVMPLTNLKELHMCNNRVGEYVRSISHLTNLTSLDIRQNNLASAHIPFLASLIKLESLCLSGNGSLVEEPGIETLSTLTDLRSLDVGGSSLFSKPEVLREFKFLKCLKASSNYLGKNISVLSDYSCLVSLDIAVNRIGEHVTSLTPLVSLTFLNIAANNIEEHFTVLGVLTNLTYLDLRWNNIENPQLWKPNIILPSLSQLRTFEWSPQWYREDDD